MDKTTNLDVAHLWEFNLNEHTKGRFSLSLSSKTVAWYGGRVYEDNTRINPVYFQWIQIRGLIFKERLDGKTKTNNCYFWVVKKGYNKGGFNVGWVAYLRREKSRESYRLPALFNTFEEACLVIRYSQFNDYSFSDFCRFGRDKVKK